MTDPSDPQPDPPAIDARWFRTPTRREHVIASWLFIGFGLFFFAMFHLCYGWGFRWVIFGLGVFSVWNGVRHAIDSKRGNPS